MAEPNVTEAQVKVSSALVAVDNGEVNVFVTSVIAEKRNMVLMSTENISSVKRVSLATMLEVEVSAAAMSIRGRPSPRPGVER